MGRVGPGKFVFGEVGRDHQPDGVGRVAWVGRGYQSDWVRWIYYSGRSDRVDVGRVGSDGKINRIGSDGEMGPTVQMRRTRSVEVGRLRWLRWVGRGRTSRTGSDGD